MRITPEGLGQNGSDLIKVLSEIQLIHNYPKGSVVGPSEYRERAESKRRLVGSQ